MATILIVDDDLATRDTLAEILELSGHVVRKTCDARRALAMLREGYRPSVILLDLMMPEMDGWGFRRELLREEELASIPVYVLSANVREERPTEIAGFFPKPLEVARLLESLRARG